MTSDETLDPLVPAPLRRIAGTSVIDSPFELLLHLDVEPGRIQRLDQCFTVEFACDFEGGLLWLGGIALDAVNGLHRRLDRLATHTTTVVRAGQRQALHFALFDAAIVLDRQLFVSGVAVETARRKGVDR